MQRIHSLVLFLGCVSGCIRPPDVVLLDRKTVLEEQASGELYPLENDLREAAIVPKGEDFTRAQLQESGADLSRDSLNRIVAVHGLLRAESEILDELLVRRCIGEARSGLLVETPKTCAGRTDEARTSATVQRVNRARRQLWRWIQEQPGSAATDEEVRATWRAHHLQSVVCGGQIETEDGSWGIKPC